MNCKCCDELCIKSGFYATGVQRYRCKRCRRYQQSSYIYKGCERGIARRVEVLTVEGCGIRSISRILKVSIGKVMSSIKELWRLKRKEKRLLLLGREYELDEMRTYIGSKKKKYWIVYAIDRATKDVIDFKVGKRNNKTLRRVIDTMLLARAKKIYTDKLRNYVYLIPEELHSTKKYSNNRIERKNLSVRTHLKRLGRKTICFSRSVSMLEATLGVYFWKNNLSFI